MKKAISLLLLAALMTGCLSTAAMAYELNGTVVSAVTQNITSVYGGTVEDVPVHVGQTVRAGETVAVLKTAKVYAKESGRVYFFGSAGDDGETLTATYGAVAYLEPEIAYSVTGSTKYAYDSAANKTIHPGETVMLRSTEGDSTGRGLITSVADSSFEVLVTSSGDLLSGDTVNIFRSGNYQATNRIGRGSVVRRGPVAYDAVGIITSYAVASGQKVNKGDLLFETLSGAYQGETEGFTLIKAPVDGVIASILVNPGAAVAEGGDIVTIYPTDTLRVEVAAPESDWVSIHVGDPVKVELTYANDGDKTLNGTVESISTVGTASTSEETDEATFSVYISLTDADLGGVAYGMNAIVTSQSDSRSTVRLPLEDQEEAPDEASLDGEAGE